MDINPTSRPSSTLPCGVCIGLFTSSDNLTGSKRQSFRLNRSVEDWVDSASLGCPLCWWLLYSPSCYQRFEWSLARNFDIATDTESLTFEFGRTSDKLVSLGPLEAPGPSQKAIFFELVAREGDPACVDGCKVLPPVLSFTAESTFKLTREWLNGCQSRHSGCTLPEPGVMPKRVLDVLSYKIDSNVPEIDDNGRVYLCSSNSLQSAHPYATLSYCWGNPGQQLLTTKENLTEFMESGIPLSKIPRSVRDAILVTQGLDIRFLWVDALCIAQDDDDEKDIEISRMGDIYRNSEVTISAASVSSVGESFLEQRENWSGENLPIVWLPYARDGCIGLLHNLMPALRVQDAIHKRAWTMQETLLARRLLVYSMNQLYFACMSTRLDSSMGEMSLGGNRTAINNLRRPIHPDPEARKSSKTINWKNIVADYSERQMSVSSDKLPALAGVAQLFGTSEDYLAGLWRQEFPGALLWKPAKGQYGCMKATTWRGPSWSWTSLDGVIQTIDEDLIYKGNVMARLVEAQVDPVYEFSKYGSIKQAKLVLDAIIVRAFLTLASDDSLSPILKDNGHSIQGVIIGYGQLDTLEAKAELYAGKDMGRDIPIACVCIALAEQLDNLTGKSLGEIATGLLLRVVDGGKYERVGTFCSTPSGRDYFTRFTLDLEEYELPSPQNDDFFDDVYKQGYDEKEVLHEGVVCNGVLCQTDRLTQEPIRGARYFCIGCNSSYCGRCKEDRENHPNSEAFDRLGDFHAYCRFRVAVKETLFEKAGWKRKLVKIEPDRAQKFSTTLLEIV